MRRRRGKYGNVITKVGGRAFHSKKEARRFQELKLLEQEGVIANLQLQIPFKLRAWEQPICTYVADFVYTENGRPVIEDVKGMITGIFRLKWKLLQAQEKEKYLYRIT